MGPNSHARPVKLEKSPLLWAFLLLATMLFAEMTAYFMACRQPECLTKKDKKILTD